MDPAQAAQKAERITKRFKLDVQRAADANDLKKTKAVCTQAEQDLRDVKRSLGQHKKATNAAFTAERQKIDKSGQVIGAFANAKTRGAMSRSRASSKRKLAEQKLQVTERYRIVNDAIDNGIASVKRTKASITVTEPAKPARTPKPPQDKVPPPPARTAAFSVADELAKLAELKQAGILTDEEFAAQKNKLLSR